LPKGIGKTQIHEAWSRHRNFRQVDVANRSQVFGDGITKHSRGLASLLGQAQCNVGGIVAVFRSFRTFDRDLGRRLAQQPFRLGCLNRSAKKVTCDGANAVAHLPTM
jgi:hypothetical protein